jgi:ABC-type transport system substrate-binding protein
MDNIIDNIYLGNAVKSLTPVHPNSVLSSGDKVKQYEHDLNMARALVAQSGFSTGQLAFTILVNEENAERCEAAELIASELNQVGMQVTVYKVPFETYVNLLQNDSYSLFMGGTELTSRVDLRSMLSTDAQTGGINYFNYSDVQMDNLLNSCVNAASDTSYKDAVEKVQSYIADQLPFVGIAFKYNLLLTDASVKGGKKPALNDIFRNSANWYISEDEDEATEESTEIITETNTELNSETTTQENN